MTCDKEITESDLGAKICATAVKNEKNPFYLPIVVSDPVHVSNHLCGRCAKGKDACPCCNGALAPREEITNAFLLHALGEEEFARRKLPGTFEAVLVSKRQLSFFYILKDGSSTSLWMEI